MQDLARNWWLLALRGVLAIVFGLLAVINPHVTLPILVMFFGAWALVDGLCAIGTGIWSAGEGGPWVGLVTSGVIGVLIGLAVFFVPGLTTLSILYFIGIWAVVGGIGQIVSAIRVRQEISNELLLIASGVLSVIFGVWVMLFPGHGALAIVAGIGLWAIFVGCLEVGFAVRLNRWVHGRD